MTTRKSKQEESGGLVPVASGELVPSDDLSLLAERLVDQARGDGIALTGQGGLLPQLIARVLESGLGRSTELLEAVLDLLCCEIEHFSDLAVGEVDVVEANNVDVDRIADEV